MRINVRILGRDVASSSWLRGRHRRPRSCRRAWRARWVGGGFLFVLYAVYVRAHFSDAPEDGEARANPLHLTRLPGVGGRSRRRLMPGDHEPGGEGGHPRMRIIVSQVWRAGVIIAARRCSSARSRPRAPIGMDPTILALVIAPIATELPEKFNSVIWVRTGKDTLAMGNITGAMVFQSCLPTVLGMLFTEWTFKRRERHLLRFGRRRVRRDDAHLRRRWCDAGGCRRGRCCWADRSTWVVPLPALFMPPGAAAAGLH